LEKKLDRRRHNAELRNREFINEDAMVLIVILMKEQTHARIYFDFSDIDHIARRAIFRAIKSG